eukprot:m.305781 g.305781  ORF g.305781 m.305781 type:complete len:368 (+) comp15911_c0_seq8:300-1403(+)
MELEQLYPTKRAAFKLSMADPAYILEMVADPSGSLLAVSSSDGTVKVFDRTSLSMLAKHAGHRRGVVGMGFTHDGRGLWSAAQGGSVQMWDARTTGPAATHIDIGGWALSSFANSGDGIHIAVGTELKGEDASVHLYDVRRTDAPVAEFTDAHSDDIVCLAFSHSAPNRLATASTDCLCNILDLTLLSEAEEPEDCIELTLMADSSLSKVGFFGPNGSLVYGLTGDETLVLWHGEPQGDDETEEVAKFTQLREHLTEQGCATDYVVDCMFDEAADRLYLVSGEHNGTLSISNINLDTVTPLISMTGGHATTVRALQWNTQDHTIITGGEDSFLCQWTSEAPSDQSGRDRSQQQEDDAARSKKSHTAQ